ncbi:histidine kinase N-terminal 7TM domain-containing protein [Planobispora takensis]|uniref:Histidine kinase N-terminal 7TM region domain-containing protein n=1 Tax=Planobispora takensis TaxID=1367882 RepID=A0A8J3WY90_9ACTN|nr:histidine kinase N-terminal 7TM domain-containing protein [Planobispora takensis]GII05678.1 hypothetical protein Pta02_76860 [Planobispora takensis]
MHRHLVVTSAEAGGPQGFLVRFGPLFWAHTAYGYALVAFGTVRMARAWLTGPRAQRRLYAFVLLSEMPGTVSGVIVLMGAIGMSVPAPLLALAPLGFCLTSVLTFWALVRLSLHELVPVNRSQLFDLTSSPS